VANAVRVTPSTEVFETWRSLHDATSIHLKALTVATALGAFGLTAHAQSTIKVGVLHSLSGTMAISETVLKDVALMAIDEINA
jgi:ABC-type branched-subunit amino acid transport system substrate-binding protein